ncbi:hypothetical protein BJ508DRAFT_304276 [Ascobolus immersus RN42]|uniref:Uncharacterized protein n=1 Tax=Ascobolus immersus RN42 TaxID=1160509 RepID=A0A3N4IHT3_ASCIM|nr:hypothetical protein BJ508DRAFT_304276 [Ascobolus immersus RN42]
MIEISGAKLEFKVRRIQNRKQGSQTRQVRPTKFASIPSLDSSTIAGIKRAVPRATRNNKKTHERARNKGNNPKTNDSTRIEDTESAAEDHISVNAQVAVATDDPNSSYNCIPTPSSNSAATGVNSPTPTFPTDQYGLPILDESDEDHIVVPEHLSIFPGASINAYTTYGSNDITNIDTSFTVGYCTEDAPGLTSDSDGPTLSSDIPDLEPATLVAPVPVPVPLIETPTETTGPQNEPIPPRVEDREQETESTHVAIVDTEAAFSDAISIERECRSVTDHNGNASFYYDTTPTSRERLGNYDIFMLADYQLDNGLCRITENMQVRLGKAEFEDVYYIAAYAYNWAQEEYNIIGWLHGGIEDPLYNLIPQHEVYGSIAKIYNFKGKIVFDVEWEAPGGCNSIRDDFY